MKDWDSAPAPGPADVASPSGHDEAPHHEPERSARELTFAYGRAVVLLYFFVFATTLAFVVPPFEAPDEPDHLEYVNFVAERRELPNHLSATQPRLREGFQPPLYYMCGAVLTTLLVEDRKVDFVVRRNRLHVWGGGRLWDVPVYVDNSTRTFPQAPASVFDGRVDSVLREEEDTESDRIGFYALRMLSVLFGMLTVYVVLLMSRLFIPDRGWDLLPGFLLASLPQFAFISATVNNDPLANLLAACVLYFAFRILEDPARLRPFLMAGLFMGIGLCVKKSVLFAMPGIGLLLAYCALMRHEQFVRIVRNASLGLLAGVAASAWVVGRSILLYGEFFGMSVEMTGTHDATAEFASKGPFDLYFFGPKFLPNVLKSFVWNFGWMNFEAPPSVYQLYWAIAVVGLVGVFLHARARRFVDVRVYLALVFVGLCFAALWAFNMIISQPQGRYLFPAVSLVCVLGALGVRTVLGLAGRDLFVRLALWCLLLGLVLTDLAAVAAVHFYYFPVEHYL